MSLNGYNNYIFIWEALFALSSFLNNILKQLKEKTPHIIYLV